METIELVAIKKIYSELNDLDKSEFDSWVREQMAKRFKNGIKNVVDKIDSHLEEAVETFFSNVRDVEKKVVNAYQKHEEQMEKLRNNIQYKKDNACHGTKNAEDCEEKKKSD